MGTRGGSQEAHERDPVVTVVRLDQVGPEVLPGCRVAVGTDPGAAGLGVGVPGEAGFLEGPGKGGCCLVSVHVSSIAGTKRFVRFRSVPEINMALSCEDGRCGCWGTGHRPARLAVQEKEGYRCSPFSHQVHFCVFYGALVP